jgi:hypothetical protein
MNVMPNRFRLFVILGCTGALAAAHAEDVYKCTKADESISFQDTPCAADQIQKEIHITKPPSSTSAVSAPGEGEAPAIPDQPQQKMITQASGVLPQMWDCVRAEDGSHYVSRDGATPPRMVPLGIMGGPSKSLASAYGPGGIGVSAPGMGKTPINTSPQAEVANDYVAVQDRCEPQTKEQVCMYLQQQYNELQKKMQRAFKDDQATLKPQEDQLSHELNGC